MRHTLRGVTLVGLTLLLAACDSPDLLGPNDVAGTYALRSIIGVAGAAPSQGQLRLMPNGEAERRLTFEGAAEPTTFVWLGRYRVRNAVLELAFWPQGTTDGELFYHPVAYKPGLVVLTYGQPADGADVVEVYEN